jgi:hypothetical protein
MPTFHGLYYPYVHFQDEGWLKAAALYWDEMNRIVPDKAYLEDSDEVKRFEQDGFVVRRHPIDAAFTIMKPFRDLLRTHGEVLRREFGIEPPGPFRPEFRAYGRRFLGTEDEISYISEGKFGDAFLRDLIEHGLVMPTPRDEKRGVWFGMHREMARVYMTALAETLAPDIGARPLADNAFDHIAIAGVTMERLFDVLLGNRSEPQKSNEIEGQMASIAFRQVIPREIAKIPASKIIEFRKAHAEERTQFHDEIGRTVKEMEHLSEIRASEELASHLDEIYQNRMKGKLERLEKAMRRANWDVIDGALGATFALPAMLAAGLGAVLPAAGVATVGVAVGGWRLWRKRQNTKADANEPSAEAYLYNAKRFFSAQELIQDIETGGRSFAP